MKTSVVNLLEDAQKKMSGYVALYNYRLLNLSIKANPEALLSVFVEADGEKQTIEQVAKARNAAGREDQFEIFPLNRDLLFPLIKGIKEVHPEYDLDIRNVDEDEDEEEELKEKYILATMPVVNDDRHDVLTQAVKILSDVCDGQLEYVFSRTSAEVALKLANSPADELDEAKDALQQIRERHEELLKKFRAEKEKEIEEAYQLYLAGAAEQEARKQEEAAAAQEALAGLQMKWNPDEDD